MRPGVPSARSSFVIVGANLTGGAAVSTLRSEGFDGRIILLGEERHPPYERPPLSKGYLRGEAQAEDMLLRPASWYAENDVDLVLGRRARLIDPLDEVVVLEDGESIPYDEVLVATGGQNRRLSVPGEGLEGIFDLRTIEDADRIREAARSGGKAVVVGAGFIGAEVAASLRGMGVEVEVVEIFHLPLLRAVGPEVAAVFEAIHRDHGVRFHFRQAVERFEGGSRVERVVTTMGGRIECDLVVVGVGIEPATDVVSGGAVVLDNGIVVDEFCRASADGVYAAGDVANHYHPLFERRVRVEHWDNALKQGAAAARNMLGRGEVFDDPHWFWSDQYEHDLQVIGLADDWDEFVVRGSIEERSFVAFYTRRGVVKSAIAIDRGKELRRAARLIRSKRPVAAAALRDEETDLRKLA